MLYLSTTKLAHRRHSDLRHHHRHGSASRTKIQGGSARLMQADDWWNLSKISKSFHRGRTPRSVQWWLQRGPGFLSPSFVFHVSPSISQGPAKRNMSRLTNRSAIETCTICNTANKGYWNLSQNGISINVNLNKYLHKIRYWKVSQENSKLC